jgi:hypothetical protein
LLFLIGGSWHIDIVLSVVYAFAALGLGLLAFPVSRGGKLNASIARCWIKAERPGAFAAQLVVVVWRLLLQLGHVSLKLLYICFQLTDFVGLLLLIAVAAL